VRAQHAAIERLAGLLRASEAESPPQSDRAWTAITAMTSLVALRASEDRAPDSAELEAIAEVL
jgi:hypothetical protein